MLDGCDVGVDVGGRGEVGEAGFVREGRNEFLAEGRPVGVEPVAFYLGVCGGAEGNLG